MGRTSRHDHVKTILASFCRQAGISAEQEVKYIFDDSGDKPADILFPDWRHGRHTCVDITLVSPLTVANLPKSAKEGGGGSAIKAASASKRLKYEERCHAKGHDFTPFVIETTGGFGPEALAIMDRIGRVKADKEKLTSVEGIKRVRLSVGFVAMRNTASMIIRRSPR